MHKGIYSFDKDGYSTLSEAVMAAADRIYTAGIMFRNDQIGPGGNNVMADSAANAFKYWHLVDAYKEHDEVVSKGADIIILRQAFQSAQGDDKNRKLQQIFDKVQELKALGWEPTREPVRLNGPAPV
jgi:hypothetical protein